MKLVSRLHAQELDDALEPIDWAVIPRGIRRVDVDAPSGRLATIEAGNAENPRVLLVPGATGSKEDFVRMLPVFAEHGFFVQSVDLAGQYESHKAGPENLSPPRRRYEMDLFVNDMITLLERGSRPAHVLGYSFAGNVAQETFSRRPDLFASLTFLSAPPTPGQTFRKVKRIGWISLVTNGPMGAVLMIEGIKRNAIPVPPDRLAFVRHRFAFTRRSSVADAITLMRNTPNHRDVLRQADMPKLVTVGKHDLWPVEIHQDFADSIGATMHVYDAGHSPCEETPHQLAWDMMEAFAAASGSRTG